MIRTYVDANALIVAFRGDYPASAEALKLLGDKHRRFVASAYLRLETLRKPHFLSTRRRNCVHGDLFRHDQPLGANR